ncbi:MAG: dialkylresorcinol condensing enzyme DarA [Thermodesulfobacteriota bacterium]
MKKILVIYYSQSGQLAEIVDSVLKPLKKNENISIVFQELKPRNRYPFPWTRHQFCDAFPEAFQEIPCELEPFAFNPEDDFDLIILAYTVWYLSPATPISAFLQSPEAQKVIRNRPVITLIGCRNMWLLAQEKVKKRIAALGGEIKGNIVLMDRAMNLVGIVTIAAWMFTGKKERFLKIFPRPGVSDQDIREAGRFGDLILDSLAGETFDLDQQVLNRHGAVPVFPAYIIFEQRIHKVFSIWSKFILQKGGPADPNRKFRVRLFFYYLLVAIILIAPLATLVSWVVRLFNKQKIQKAIAYFSQNQLKPF